MGDDSGSGDRPPSNETSDPPVPERDATGTSVSGSAPSVGRSDHETRLSESTKEQIELHVARLFREDAAKHREYLAESTNHAKWAVSIMTLVMVFGAGLFSWKSTADLDKVKESAETRIEQVATTTSANIRDQEQAITTSLHSAYAKVLQAEVKAKKNELVGEAVRQLKDDLGTLASEDAIRPVIREVLRESEVVAGLRAQVTADVIRSGADACVDIAEGEQLCWGYLELGTQGKHTRSFKVTFARPFREPPTVTTGLHASSGGYAFAIFNHTVSTKQFYGAAVEIRYNETVAPARLNYVAIGRR